MSKHEVEIAFADGMRARHNGKPKESCPHVGGLESAWVDGWSSADTEIAELALARETIRIVVGEITDFLTRKAERFSESGDAKSAILFETLVEYIWKEWGADA